MHSAFERSKGRFGKFTRGWMQCRCKFIPVLYAGESSRERKCSLASNRRNQMHLQAESWRQMVDSGGVVAVMGKEVGRAPLKASQEYDAN